MHIHLHIHPQSYLNPKHPLKIINTRQKKKNLKKKFNKKPIQLVKQRKKKEKESQEHFFCV
jgi:diadenosine tetraphosphate (Ap4A) HIT family hydrolase